MTPNWKHYECSSTVITGNVQTLPELLEHWDIRKYLDPLASGKCLTAKILSPDDLVRLIVNPLFT